MATEGHTVTARTRARRWFWFLVVTAIVLMGILYRTLSSEPGPRTATLFVLVAVLLLASTVQAVRVWLALEAPGRARRRGRRGGAPWG